MKNRTWSKYAFEFLSIFIAVISAFALNNWNDHQNNIQAENKILVEIYNGLTKDVDDVNQNIMGHEFGLKACNFWRKVIRNERVNSDTIRSYYFNFTRDFISIQNTSGYENLKSRGLEIIQNDSLRTAIIAMYEYNFNTLKILEEDYHEMQFHENYFNEINAYVAPHFEFNVKGEIIDINAPLNLSEEDQNRLLSYIWRIEENRRFILGFYKKIHDDINSLRDRIEKEII